MSDTLIPKHGGYRQLKSFQNAQIVYDLTVEFCKRFVEPPEYRSHRSYLSHASHNRSDMSHQSSVSTADKSYRWTRQSDQMIQAARSGTQNIAEGSQASGTSKKTEIKLTNVARASLEELLLDYEDLLRQRGLCQME